MTIERDRGGDQNAPNDFRTQLLGGAALIDHNQIDKAIPVLEHAQTMFPEYGGDDSPYALLADGVREEGGHAEAGRGADEVDDVDRDERRGAAEARRPAAEARQSAGRGRRARSR